MYIEIIVAILSSSILTSLVNGFLNRRKNSVEIEDKINQMAGRLIDDQREEIDALHGHILQLQTDYEKSKAQNILLKVEIAKLKEAISDYEGQIEKLRQSIRELSEN